jgi:hypothetical protein
MKSNFLYSVTLLFTSLTLISCSFVERLPGDHHITLVDQSADTSATEQTSNRCKTLKEISFETKTTTLFITRSEKAIAEELQILAQNEAIRSYANGIWPSSKILYGKQSFLILRCSHQ